LLQLNLPFLFLAYIMYRHLLLLTVLPPKENTSAGCKLRSRPSIRNVKVLAVPVQVCSLTFTAINRTLLYSRTIYLEKPSEAWARTMIKGCGFGQFFIKLVDSEHVFSICESIVPICFDFVLFLYTSKQRYRSPSYSLTRLWFSAFIYFVFFGDS
jgi:hypothetical protein